MCLNTPAIILSSIESAYVLSNLFLSKPSILFSQLRNHSTVSLAIPLGDYIFLGAYFEQFSLSSRDVNESKGVAKTAL